MLARARRSDRLIGRVRGRGPATSPPAAAAAAPATAPVPATTLTPATVPALTTFPVVRSIPPNAGADRRDLDPSLDTAVYNCHCGFVFEAPVCTSIACPHCGDCQAW
jgi:hypothetical protein